MARRNRAYFEQRLRELAPIMGWNLDAWANDKERRVGAVLIDYAPMYGGYSLRRITNVQGGQTNIGPSKRMSPQEFYTWLDGLAYGMGWSAAKHQQDFQAALPRSDTTEAYYQAEHVARVTP